MSHCDVSLPLSVLEHSSNVLSARPYIPRYSGQYPTNKITMTTNVSPPRPIDVKKLIENRVFLGLSLGIKPSKAG